MRLGFRWRRLFALLSVILGSISFTLYILLATATGTRWILEFIEPYTPVKTTHAEGSLLNGLRADLVEITLPTASISAEHIFINLDLWPLLFNQELKISEFHVKQLSLKTSCSEPQEVTSIAIPTLPTLPISAHIKHLTIETLSVDEIPDIAISIEEALLAKQQLTWREVNIKQGNNYLASNGKWRSDLLQQALTAQIEWEWETMKGELTITGPLQQLAITHQFFNRLSADNPVEINLTSEGIVKVNDLETISFNLHHSLESLTVSGVDITRSNMVTTGDLNAFDMQLNSSINQPDVGEVTISASAKGEYTGKILSTIKADLLEGTLTIKSELDNVSSLKVSNTLLANQLNLTKLPAYSLEQDLTTKIQSNFEFDLKDPLLPWQVASIKIDGQFNGKPFNFSAKANGNNKQAKVTDIQFRQSQDSIKARFNIDEKRLEGNATASIANLQHYAPQIRGSLYLQTTFNSQLDNIIEQSKLNIQAQSDELAVGEFTIGALNLLVNSQGKRFLAELNSDFIHSNNVAFANLSQQWSGHIDKDKINIDGTGTLNWIYQGQTIPLPEQITSFYWDKKSPQWATLFIRAADKNIVIDGQVSLTKDNQLLGMVNAQTLNLTWLKTFSPRIDTLDGNISYNAQLGGSIDNPQLTSAIKLAADKVKLVDPDFPLNTVLIEGDIQPDWSFKLFGSAKQQDRPINLTGSGWILGENAPQISLHIHAEDLSANTPMVEVAVSPNLDINLHQNNVSITGDITIPRAEIEISRLPNPSYSASPDVVVVGRNEEKTTASFNHDVDLTLTIADKVIVKAAGMSTKLMGQLHVKAQTDKPNLVQGRLNLVDGSLDSNGQSLVIKKGELIFSGSSDNPGVDIIAVRQIADPKLEVGIHITGTLKRMQTDIVSFPSIDQSRALSFLAFGKDISKSSTGETDNNAQLMSAAVSLGIGQSSALIQNLRRSTGLDELAAIANDSGSASLIAGKQISNKLFARYRYDMAEAIGILLLRYQLNKQWSLEAESGNDTSIDVLYRLGD